MLNNNNHFILILLLPNTNIVLFDEHHIKTSRQIIFVIYKDTFLSLTSTQ